MGGILYKALVQNRQSLLQGHRKLPNRIEKACTSYWPPACSYEEPGPTR